MKRRSVRTAESCPREGRVLGGVRRRVVPSGAESDAAWMIGCLTAPVLVGSRDMRSFSMAVRAIREDRRAGIDNESDQVT